MRKVWKMYKGYEKKEKWVFSHFFGCFEMIENLSIYRPRNRINLEIIYGSIKWPNWLGLSIK